MRDFSYVDIVFSLVWAARWTLLLSTIAFVGGGAAGFLLLLLRISTLPPLQYLSRLYAEVVQGTPLLIQFLLVFFGLSIVGINIDAWTAAILVLTIFTSAFLSDIWRGAVESVSKGQWEAAQAVSLGYFQQLGLVILPQALRLSIAPTVGFLAQVIKGTSLASAIGFVELARTATNIANVTFEPFFVYLVTAVVYFGICFPISLVSRRLERSLQY